MKNILINNYKNICNKKLFINQNNKIIINNLSNNNINNSNKTIKLDKKTNENIKKFKKSLSSSKLFKKVEHYRKDDSNLLNDKIDNISEKEQLKLLMDSGLKYSEANDIISFIDQNGDGTITISELNSFVTLFGDNSLENKINTLFYIVDDDHDILIDKFEFEEKIEGLIETAEAIIKKDIIKELNKVDEFKNVESFRDICDKIFENVDINDDGSIEYSELKNYLLNSNHDGAKLLRECLNILNN